MNYIILNGINSTTIRGLLIQSLPPITKPLMRTQVDVVDGRDGDTVTPLGYAAYDKPITIGLHGNYDINEVIAFFATSGTVVFSNEPDKYYRYAVYAQIDFERLIRFRTATVTFHVQPFKYSAAETTVKFNNQLLNFADAIKTVSGITASLVGNVVSISGSASAATDIRLPISAVTIDNDDYILEAFSAGNNVDIVSMRLIYNNTSTSFGNAALQLDNNNVVKLNGSGAASYNYLHFHVDPGDINITVNVLLCRASNVTMTIRNNGNTYAKPQLTVYGYGGVNITLNGKQIFAMLLDGNVMIDVEKMNAYKDGVLKNRAVIGDYDNLALPPGINRISFSGMVSGMEINLYSRWT